MMMNLLKYILLTFLLSFAACSSDDDGVPSVPNGQPQPGDALELTVSAADFVTDGAPDTRATDNDKTTTFENDDRVGVIILDEGDKPIYNNIPYKYNNGKWTFDSGNDEGKGECYYDSKATTFIVYYPYSRAADGVTSVDDLKAKFAPRFNQSDIKDYCSSDLMVWNSSPEIPPVTTLDVKLTHAYASVYITPIVKYLLDDEKNTECITSSSNISDANFTINDVVYVPYHATDGSLRCILPTGFTTGDVRCFYTISSKTYSNIVSISGVVSPNRRYTSSPKIIHTYRFTDAKVGDFYCKRSSDDKGYLIPDDIISLSNDQKNACLGIVMKVGKDNAGPWKDDCIYNLKNSNIPMSTIHGYVLALYDANSGKTCKWGSYGRNVNTDTEQTTGFYGYKNTQTIINNRSGNLARYFPATFYATENYESSYSAPSNSSGWFLPSSGQGQYWLNNKTVLLTQVKKATGNDSYNWKNEYWSSSEYSNNPIYYARYALFRDGYIAVDSKDNYCSVRSCLAF